MKKFLLISFIIISTGFTACKNSGESEKKTGTVAPAAPGTIAAQAPASNSIVSLVQSGKAQAAELAFDDVKALVEEAVEIAGGLGSIVKYGDTVVLKPNLITTVYYWAVSGDAIPQTANGICTDYRVVKAAAQMVREIIGPKGQAGSGKIIVMEGSGKGSTRTHFINAGYTQANLPEVDEIIALEDEGVWAGAGDGGGVNANYVVKVALDNFTYNTAPASGAHSGYYKNDGVYYVNKKMYEADALISLPVVKNHWNAVVTGGIKNISIGAAPPKIYGIADDDVGRNNMVNHDSPGFHQWIADYFSCIPADFVIMDGLQGCENGPLPWGLLPQLQASQKNMRAILASKDALAIDTVETNIINWDYETVAYLQYLTARGEVGANPRKQKITVNGNPQNITVLGNITVDDIRADFEGRLPMAGGGKLTAAQLARPELSIASAEFEGQNLNLKLNISDDTVKADIYIDNNYAASFAFAPSETVRAESVNINFDSGEIASGPHQITVRAYTKWMAHAEKTATITNEPYDYAAPFAETAPVIDGSGDDPAWAKAPWKPIDQEWIGTIPSPDVFSGRYKIVWTEDRLYYLVEIVDNYISATRLDTPLVDFHEDDCLELFIDEDASGGIHQYNYNAWAYHLSFGGENVAAYGSADRRPRLYNDHFNYKIGQNGATYTWEAEMKVFDDSYNENSNDNIPVKLYAGKKMGFAAAYCDADATHRRERFIGSVFIPGADKNVAWINASVFAKLYLVIR